MEADRGWAGGDETFDILVTSSLNWELFGIFLANQTIRLQCTLTQGYLHLFLTVTATRSASSAETKEEIVSKYVIALNETLTEVIFDMQGIGQGKGVGWLEVK